MDCLGNPVFNNPIIILYYLFMARNKNMNTINVNLPKNHFIFGSKKSFYDLCRMLLNPIGSYQLIIFCDNIKNYRMIKKMFSEATEAGNIKCLRIITPFGLAFVYGRY
jgi:hypothetical protein